MTTSEVTPGSVVVGIEGVDGFPESVQAVKWAARQAAVTQRLLVIAHATGRAPTWARSADVKEAIEEIHGRGRADAAAIIARDAAPDISVTTVVRPTGPVELLLELATEARLVVVGSHGLGPVASILKGSVSLQVAAQAAAPVVVVRQGGVEPSTPARVVVGADGREDSSGALRFAFEQAELLTVPVTIVTCHDGLREPRQLQSESEALEELVTVLGEKHPDVRYELKPMHGRAAACLVEESGTAELLVVGARRKHTRAAMVLGSVSQAVVEQSHCNVAVVRPGP